ncbi:MAG TPA: hypothetical protein VJY62_11670 [Bacteroidia bacterium]|nr:hypothetical protein [Bacteroidia bacterium]
MKQIKSLSSGFLLQFVPALLKCNKPVRQGLYKMKTAAFILSVFITHISIAQKIDFCYAGVYLTNNDLVNKHLSNAVNTMIKGNSVGFASSGKTIKVITSGKTVKFKPGSISGFYDCDATYRYSPDVELYSPEDYYRIEEIGDLVIYTSVFYGGTEHFYSISLSAQIHRLNLKNIENDFVQYPKFIEEVIKMKSANMGEIAVRDVSGFKINKIYRQIIVEKK